VWISNARNNFAPFAGFMLRGLREERLSVESAGEEIDEAVEMRPGGGTVGNKLDDVSF